MSRFPLPLPARAALLLLCAAHLSLAQAEQPASGIVFLSGGTREQLQLPRGKVIDGVASVRSGVVRIAELQAKGFSYLKVE